jgi:predicted DNA-binding transcriptional regulator
MPENTIIKNTEPLAQIESGEITNIHFINPTNIEVTYYFSPYTQPGSNISPIYFVILIIIATILIILTLHNLSKNKKITGRQKQIFQTLTDNELRIIKLLLELRKPLRRSFIEKKLEIAKSSLATTLQNLERKKLIILDKTYTTHIIKLEEWFKKL